MPENSRRDSDSIRAALLTFLVALGMLERLDECYANTPESYFYLDSAKSSYIGNYFELWNVRGWAKR